MRDNVFFSYLGPESHSAQEPIIYVKLKDGQILLHSQVFGIFWKEVEYGRLKDDFEIFKPRYVPATLLEIEKAGFLPHVHGVIEFLKGSTREISFM